MRKHAILGQTFKAGFFTSLALAIGAGVGGGMAIANAIKPKEKAPSQPTVLQNKAATKTADQIKTEAKDTASEQALKKRRARTKTVLTGPRGLLTEPKTEQKALLGA